MAKSTRYNFCTLNIFQCKSYHKKGENFIHVFVKIIWYKIIIQYCKIKLQLKGFAD